MFEDFFKRHQDTTVFVIAAGNDGEDVAAHSHALAQLRGENLVKVANLQSSFNTLHKSSSTSKIFVDIAAVGTHVRANVPYAQAISLTGTSMAAPQVSNVLLRILEARGHIAPKELIEVLYSDYTVTGKTLAETVKNMRVLKLNHCEHFNFLEEMNLCEGPYTMTVLDGKNNKYKKLTRP
jgi:hypothetical protein